MFELHPKLAEDCVVVGDLPLCRVLLAKDGRYPWLILVPMRVDIREIYQLSESDQRQLLRESCAVAEAMARFFDADKMNVAALGNQVPQLHIHHIVRYKSDAAWPAPVWGVLSAQPYQKDALEKRLAEIQKLIAGLVL